MTRHGARGGRLGLASAIASEAQAIARARVQEMRDRRANDG